MRGLLGQKCKVYRFSDTLDAYNTPIGEASTLIGTYNCRLTRKVLSAKQEAMTTNADYVYTLYVMPNVDIELGDIVEIDGISYRCAEPYKPTSRIIHHKEIEVYIEKEA